MDVESVRAVTRGVRISPRKVRLITNLVKGRKVLEAQAILRFMPQRAAIPVRKLVESAAANAEIQYNGDPKNLVIANIVADEGPTWKNRVVPRSRGRMGRILGRTSHITVWIEER